MSYRLDRMLVTADRISNDLDRLRFAERRVRLTAEFEEKR